MGSIHAEDSVISDEIVGDSDIPEEDNEDAPIKTYTDLFNQINETEEGSVLSLTEDYRFNMPKYAV